MARLALLSSSLLLLSACAPDLREDFPFDGSNGSTGHVTNEADGAGWKTRVDATHKEAWVYVDLDSAEGAQEVDALTTGDWDLAFQRFKIVSNSGVSGPGTVEVAALEGGSYDGMEKAPASGYVEDRPDGSDSNSDVDSAFLEGDGWYAYDLLAHKVAPREVLYVVRTPAAYFKVRLLAYYDQVGSSAKPQFRWAKVAAP